MKKYITGIFVIATISFVGSTFLTNPESTKNLKGHVPVQNFIAAGKTKASNTEKHEPTVGAPATTLTSQSVVVQGISDDPGVFKRPNFINNTYLFGKTHQDIEKTIHEDAATFVLNNIDTPLFMEFSPSGDKTFFTSKIYAQPNDTIRFEVKDNTLTFTGKNAAQNNLYSELEKATPKYSGFPYEGNLFLYKDGIKSIYEEKQAFLEEYRTKHKLSNAFVNIFEKHLKYQYYDNLISPRSKAVNNGEFYVNDYDALPNLIEKEYNNSEVPFDMASYLDHLTYKDFQDFTAMRHTHFLKNSMIIFIRHYFVKTEAPPFSKEHFIAEREFIKSKFSGEIRDYAMGRLIWDYYNKGFAFGMQNIRFMLDEIKTYVASVEGKTTHIAAMNKIKKDIQTYDFKLSEIALRAKMVNHLGDTITLADIFSRSNKRVKVIDFWASWCPPCIRQIQNNKPFKDRLSVENNVEWIYLSVDSDKEKWLDRSETLDETLHFRNSYLLVKGMKSSLARALSVQQIPRYLIVNEQNKIVVNNAPSPKNEEAFEKIIDEIRPSALLSYRE
jgi:thiol-disulfide isomerase/thioredoxin